MKVKISHAPHPPLESDPVGQSQYIMVCKLRINTNETLNGVMVTATGYTFRTDIPNYHPGKMRMPLAMATSALAKEWQTQMRDVLDVLQDRSFLQPQKQAEWSRAACALWHSALVVRCEKLTAYLCSCVLGWHDVCAEARHYASTGGNGQQTRAAGISATLALHSVSSTCAFVPAMTAFWAS